MDTFIYKVIMEGKAREVAERYFGAMGMDFPKLKKEYPWLTRSRLQGIIEMYIDTLKILKDDMYKHGKFYEENLKPTSCWQDNFYTDHSDTIGGIALVTVGHKDLHYKPKRK